MGTRSGPTSQLWDPWPYDTHRDPHRLLRAHLLFLGVGSTEPGESRFDAGCSPPCSGAWAHGVASQSQASPSVWRADLSPALMAAVSLQLRWPWWQQERKA